MRWYSVTFFYEEAHRRIKKRTYRGSFTVQAESKEDAIARARTEFEASGRDGARTIVFTEVAAA